MAHDRLTPCLHYVCKGECTKGRNAEHERYCQRCDKYQPRAKIKHENKKKNTLRKISRREADD